MSPKEAVRHDSVAPKCVEDLQMGQICAVAGDGQLSSRHEVDPGRGSGSPREASAELSTVPPVCSLPFGAPMPRRHGSSMRKNAASSLVHISSFFFNEQIFDENWKITQKHGRFWCFLIFRIF